MFFDIIFSFSELAWWRQVDLRVISSKPGGILERVRLLTKIPARGSNPFHEKSFDGNGTGRKFRGKTLPRITPSGKKLHGNR